MNSNELEGGMGIDRSDHHPMDDFFNSFQDSILWDLDTACFVNTPAPSSDVYDDSRLTVPHQQVRRLFFYNKLA